MILSHGSSMGHPWVTHDFMVVVATIVAHGLPMGYPRLGGVSPWFTHNLMALYWPMRRPWVTHDVTSSNPSVVHGPSMT